MSEPSKPASEVVSDILTSVSSLVRDEFALARAELASNLGNAASAIIAMAVSGLLGITVINLLAAALVVLLIETGLAALWAILTVALILAILAAVIFISAKNRLTAGGLLPRRAARNIQRDAAAIKEAYSDN